MNDTPSRIAALKAKFAEQFHSEAEFIVRAPGRVNLIGEHTDYNDGFVFPAAIDRDVLIAASRRPDRQVRAFALNFEQASTFTLDGVQPTSDTRERWSNYVRAMAWVLEQEGHAVTGLNLVTQGDVPLGAGLSSSAALLVASGLTFATGANLSLDKVKLALLAQRAEREFVGVNVGIMDQFISSLGQKDHALLIDTRSLTYEAVPLPRSGVAIVIADTNKKRGLVDSEYNTRRMECERAVELLKPLLPGITALRDVSVEDFNRFAAHLPESETRLDPATDGEKTLHPRRRARHVVTEDARTLASVTALKAGDLPRFGQLMNQSHESLKNDYEVSCRELDVLVDAARSVQGVYGARMTGAGFGGCTVSLVAEDAVEAFQRDVPPRYKATTGLETTIYVTRASQGAEVL